MESENNHTLQRVIAESRVYSARRRLAERIKVWARESDDFAARLELQKAEHRKYVHEHQNPLGHNEEDANIIHQVEGDSFSRGDNQEDLLPPACENILRAMTRAVMYGAWSSSGILVITEKGNTNDKQEE